MFTLSKKSTSQKGYVLLVVIKDGKLDKSGNAYVQQQVPEDFADYLIGLEQATRKKALEEAAKICEAGMNPRNAAGAIMALIEA